MTTFLPIFILKQIYKRQVSIAWNIQFIKITETFEDVQVT